MPTHYVEGLWGSMGHSIGSMQDMPYSAEYCSHAGIVNPRRSHVLRYCSIVRPDLQHFQAKLR